MKRQKSSSLFTPASARLAAVAILAAAFTSGAHAGANKVFGAQWAWDNNFNNSVINTTFGSGSTPSMTVSFNFSANNLYGYPACIRGWHYGFNPANDNLFPMQVSAATSVPCTFSYSQSGTNMGGDFAYDMFLRTDNAKSTPQLEIMIWGGNNSWPIGLQTGTNVLSAGGWTFDLWEGDNTAAGYYVYTFIPHGTAGQANLPTSGSINVDMKVFFNWLQANKSSAGHYNNSMYLDVVEAGLEIVRGNGSASYGANISASTGGGGGGPIANGTYSLQNRASGKMLDNLGSTADGANVGQWTDGTSNNQRWAVAFSGGFYKLTCVTGGKCLDSINHTADGSTVAQWTSGSSTNQQWTFTATSGGYYKVINRTNGKCLDTGGSAANGGAMQFWPSGTSPNQEWRFVAP